MVTCASAHNEKHILIWEHSKWLVVSSFFFMIPSAYAFVNQLYAYSVLLGFTSLISANY